MRSTAGAVFLVFYPFWMQTFVLRLTIVPFRTLFTPEYDFISRHIIIPFVIQPVRSVQRKVKFSQTFKPKKPSTPKAVSRQTRQALSELQILLTNSIPNKVLILLNYFSNNTRSYRTTTFTYSESQLTVHRYRCD